jgi:hypothetical protein
VARTDTSQYDPRSFACGTRLCRALAGFDKEVVMARKFFFVSVGVLCLALTYHLGARNVGAQTPPLTDVARGTYELTGGDQVPMPVYSDGTPALPSECSYLITGYTGGFSIPSPYVMEGVRVDVLNGASSPSLEAYFWNEQGRSFPASATITVLAIRTNAPTISRHETWGGVKERYR